MTMYCCLCGRSMEQAAVTIAGHPVGPRCAARAGLVDLARKESGFVRLVVRKQRAPRPKTLDLFAEAA